MAVRDKPSARAEYELQQIRAQLLEALATSQVNTMYCAVVSTPSKRDTQDNKLRLSQPYH